MHQNAFGVLALPALAGELERFSRSPNFSKRREEGDRKDVERGEGRGEGEGKKKDKGICLHQLRGIDAIAEYWCATSNSLSS